MRESNNYQLWRVDWVHKRGYSANSTYVETFTKLNSKKEAHKLAKESSRLADFECWSYSLHKV